MKSFSGIALLMRTKREESNFSQNQLARKLEFKNGQFVSNIERGRCSLPEKKINDLSFVLDIPTATIIDAMTLDYRNGLKQTIKGK